MGRKNLLGDVCVSRWEEKSFGRCEREEMGRKKTCGRSELEKMGRKKLVVDICVKRWE